VGVASQLLSDDAKAGFVEKIKNEYTFLRDLHKNKKSAIEMITLEAARNNRFPIDWSHHLVRKPVLLGTKTFIDYPLKSLTATIDWTPFFHTWELAGKYPDILDDDVVGESARQLFQDAQAMLKKMIAERWIKANAVFGFFPANSVGDDVEVYTDESRTTVLTTFHMLRQQTQKVSGKSNLCLADFIAPKSSGVRDYIGAFAVTAGIDIDKKVAEFEKLNDDYNAILLKALADRLAESFAEHLHQRVRKEFWCYAFDEKLSNQSLIAEEYSGIRPAPGYPACPDHTEKPALFSLLNATEASSIQLTENFAMLPAAAVCGWYFSHPASQYFGIGKIAEDQVRDYAARKDMDVDVVKRWLAPHLIEDK
jgi:5-methyltetrahydrofolate--homocysteine methyltransferase